MTNSSTKKSHTQSTVTATLRVLKLSNKHAHVLRDQLLDHFAQTPTYPWKSIIPQLFCYLNRNEPRLRQIITDLLFRIAKDYPHLIIYPTVVGCQDGPTRIETVAAATTDDQIYDKSPAQTVAREQQQSSAKDMVIGGGGESGGEEEKMGDEENSSGKSADEEVYIKY